MAVFTEVSPPPRRPLLDRLQLGRLHELRGIGAGIENTNYFLDCDGGRCVLTLFERLTREQLPFYLRLVQHLSQRGIPVPAPKADAAGEILFEVCGKPAALGDRLHGGHILAPDVFHCEQVAPRWRACTWPGATTLAPTEFAGPAVVARDCAQVAAPFVR